MKKILLLLSLNINFSNADLLEEIQKRNVVNIAIPANAYPFGYVKDGHVAGFDYELSRLITKAILNDEKKVNFLRIDYIDRAKVLKTGEADIVIANYTHTKYREKEILFSKPYMSVNLGIGSAKDNPVKNIDELLERDVIVVSGSTGEKFMKENYPEAKLISEVNDEQAFNKLKEMPDAAIVHNNSLILGWCNKNTKFSLTTKSINQDGGIAIAVSKTEKNLSERINNELHKLMANGSLKVIYEKELCPYLGDSAYSFLPKL